MRFPRGPVRLFGPVLFYECVRLARRERYVVLRTLFPLVLNEANPLGVVRSNLMKKLEISRRFRGLRRC
jgi:hypothetical protein